jgi:hypothetical protein
MRSTRTFRSPAFALVLFAAGQLAAAARGQTTDNDDVPRERTVPRLEQVRGDIESARIRIGPLRIIPFFGLSGGYESNVLGTPDQEQDDWTATTTLGARWVIPFGSKIYLRGQALPQYVWYAELEQRRRLAGFGQASLLGVFNRVAVEAGGSVARGYNILSAEDPLRVLDDTRQGFANLEIEILRRFSVYVSGELQETRNQLEEDLVPGEAQNVKRLNREFSSARAGARYRFSPNLDLRVEVDQTQTDFVSDPSRDNESEGVTAGLTFNRPRLFLNLSGGYRDVRPGGMADFAAASAGTGSYYVSFQAARPVELEAYGHRTLGYGLRRGAPYYIETLNGGAVNLRIRNRFIVRGYGEYADVSYPVRLSGEEEDPAGRRESITTYGGGFGVRIFREIGFTASVAQSEYRSTLPTAPVEVLRFSTGLSFGGEFSR